MEININLVIALIRNSKTSSSTLIRMLDSNDYKFDIEEASKSSLYFTYKRRLELMEQMQDNEEIDKDKQKAVFKLVNYLSLTDDAVLYYARFYSKTHYFIAFIDHKLTKVITIIENSNWQETDFILE